MSSVPARMAIVMATGPSHQIPSMDLLLPSGVEREVEADQVDQVLAFPGVILIAPAPLEAPEAPLPTVKTQAAPVASLKE